MRQFVTIGRYIFFLGEEKQILKGFNVDDPLERVIPVDAQTKEPVHINKDYLRVALSRKKVILKKIAKSVYEQI
jgi:hypothetical protein